MIIIYSKHVKDKLAKTRADPIWIEDALRSPDRLIRVSHKWHAVKKLNGLSIKVIYVREKHIKIVTLFWV